MKNIKNAVLALVAIGFMGQASAFVAITVSGLPAAVFGVFGAASIGVSVRELITKAQSDPFVILGFTGLGIVLLDEHSQTVRFQALKSKDLAALGISQDEALAYNRELALVNLAFEETVHHAARNPDLTDTAVAEIWRQTAADAGVSQDTVGVIHKLSKAFRP